MYSPKRIKTTKGIRWEVSIYSNGRGSKRIRRRFTKRIEAEDFIKSYLSGNDVPKGRNDKIKDQNFYDEYEYWLLVRGEEISPSYKVRVEGIIKNLKESFPELMVEEVDSIFLTNIRKVLANNGARPATINRWTTAITSILNFSFNVNKRFFHNKFTYRAY